MRDLCNLRDWLKGADFVVGMHYGNKDCALSQCPADIVGVDASKAINLQIRHRRTKPFEEPTGIDNGWMFHLGGNDVSIRSSTCEVRPLESVIVGFTSTTGEYDFISFAAEQPSNLHSSFVERLPRRVASPVAARRITVWLLENDPHGIDDFWRHRSTGVEIQVNALMCFRHGCDILPARPSGRSVRQDRWEDITLFPEPIEGEVVLPPFDNSDCCRYRGRVEPKNLLSGSYSRFTEVGEVHWQWMMGNSEVTRLGKGCQLYG